ncbi:hypothetical protein ACXYMX_16235 [Sporosarcina sp. CAU 1771]
MLQNIEIMTPFFEGQAHERFHFKLNIEGNDYRGLFHNEEVHWFHPQPYNKIEVDDLNFIESSVRDLVNLN